MIALPRADVPAAELRAFAARIRDDPAYWYEQVLGWRPNAAARRAGLRHGWTADQWRIVQSVQTHKRTAVASGTGTGKTHIAAGEGLRFLYAHPGSIVVTTGPGATQVEELLWRDIRKIHAASQTRLGGRLLTTKLELAEDWFMIGISPAIGKQEEQAVKMQGFHGLAMLVIIDEAVGVDAPIFRAAEAITIGDQDRILACFNPTDLTSAMAREWEQEARWARVVISGRTHPNVQYNDPAIVPGAVTRGWIADHESDPLAPAIIDGLWPPAAATGIIPPAWVEAAFARWRTWQADLEAGMPRPLLRAVGADIARSGADRTVLAPRYGPYIAELQVFAGEDTMVTEGRVIAAMRVGQYTGPPATWPVAVVDVIGVGAGVYDKLVEDKWPALAFNASAAAGWQVGPRFVPATDRTGQWRFTNTRAWGWWTLREALDPAYGATLALPPSPGLKAELTAPRWTPVSGGRIQVEGKAEIRRRLLRSTDEADAVMQAVWADQVAVQVVAAAVPDAPLGLNTWDAAPAGRLGGW